MSGYLISTADRKSLVVFGVSLLPSVVTGENLEDVAGFVDLTFAISLLALAALKHHFLDHDRTLRRMLGK